MIIRTKILQRSKYIMKINREILKNINLSQKDELLGYILILEKQERLNNQEPVSAYLQEDD